MAETASRTTAPAPLAGDAEDASTPPLLATRVSSGLSVTFGDLHVRPATTVADGDDDDPNTDTPSPIDPKVLSRLKSRAPDILLELAGVQSAISIGLANVESLRREAGDEMDDDDDDDDDHSDHSDLNDRAFDGSDDSDDGADDSDGQRRQRRLRRQRRRRRRIRQAESGDREFIDEEIRLLQEKLCQHIAYQLMLVNDMSRLLRKGKKDTSNNVSPTDPRLPQDVRVALEKSAKYPSLDNWLRVINLTTTEVEQFKSVVPSVEDLVFRIDSSNLEDVMVYQLHFAECTRNRIVTSTERLRLLAEEMIASHASSHASTHSSSRSASKKSSIRKSRKEKDTAARLSLSPNELRKRISKSAPRMRTTLRSRPALPGVGSGGAPNVFLPPNMDVDGHHSPGDMLLTPNVSLPNVSVSISSVTNPHHKHLTLSDSVKRRHSATATVFQHRRGDLPIVDPLMCPDGVSLNPDTLSPMTVLNKRISHAIQHRFSVRTFMLPTPCDFCHKIVMFGVICKHCANKYHSRCAELAPPSCGLTNEMEDAFKRILYDAGGSSNPAVISSMIGAAVRNTGSPLDDDSTRSRASTDPSSPPTSASYSAASCFTTDPSSTCNTDNSGAHGAPSSSLPLPSNAAFSSVGAAPYPSEPSSSDSGTGTPSTPGSPGLSIASCNAGDATPGTLDSVPGNLRLKALAAATARSISSIIPSALGGSHGNNSTPNSRAKTPLVRLVPRSAGVNPPTLAFSTPEENQVTARALRRRSLSNPVLVTESLVKAGSGSSNGSSVDDSVLHTTSKTTEAALSLENGFKRSSSLAEWEIPYNELEFGEQIGVGLTGIVFKGKWHGDVAIKQINVEEATFTFEHLLGFRREVSILRRTRHENIVLFMGACTRDHLCIVTKFCNGPTLYAHIHVERTRFSMAQSVEVMRQIAQGMEYLHAKNIIHRNLKTKNVFLEQNGKLCIGDFGLATVGLFSVQEISTLTERKDSVRHLSPEVLSLGGEATTQSDVYSYGVVCYELMAGVPVYDGIAPTDIIEMVVRRQEPNFDLIRKDCGATLKEFLMKCLSFRANVRPSFERILDRLEPLPRAPFISPTDARDKLRRAMTTDL